VEEKNILVIGGGPEGIHTALEKAETGMQVTIVEKFPTLGAQISTRFAVTRTFRC
jgi:heterodisulfide reductase subunit A-like polyferredoxin